MKRVLIIEPDMVIGGQIRDYLDSSGYTVQLVQNAQEAIVAADNTRPNIVVLELLLVKHSGIEFLYEFRSYKEWQNIPVLVFSRATADGIGLTKKTIEDLNISMVLHKPTVKLAGLRGKIESLLFDKQESDGL